MSDPDDARTRAMPQQSRRTDPERSNRLGARAWSDTDERLPSDAEGRVGEPRIEIIPPETTAGSRPGADSSGDRDEAHDRAASGGHRPSSGAHPADTAGSPAAPDDTPDPWYIKLRDRIPEHILGGRMRTSTLALIVTWVALLVVFAWLNPNGTGGDAGTATDGNVVIPEGYQLTPVPVGPMTTEEIPETTSDTSETTTSGSGTTTTSGSGVGTEEDTETGTATTGSESELPELTIPGFTQRGTDSGESTSSP